MPAAGKIIFRPGRATFFLAGAAAMLMLTLVLTTTSSAEVSFAGKTVDVIMGSAPGGGTDGTTRLVGSFLEKYLPGKPSMRYRNIPGGHGSKGLNYFATTNPNGLTWAGGSSAHTDPQALRKSVVEYNPTHFGFFGGVSRGGSIVFVRKSKLPNLTDRSKPPVVVAMIDGNRSWEQLITFGQEFLGWNVKNVVGYPGTSYMLLAIRRGEADMMGTSNLLQLKEMLGSGEFVGVTQLGGGDTGEGDDARTAFQDIPTFGTLMEGKTAGLAKEAFEFWSALNDIDKWYALPPNTPKDIVETYRAAWGRISKDPEFIKQGKRLFSEDFKTYPGRVQQEYVAKTSYPEKEIIAFMQDLKTRYGLPAEPLSDAELAAMAKAKGLDKMDAPEIPAKLTAVGKGGREIEFLGVGASKKADISSSRTKVTIAGKKASRDQLKPGMQCKIALAPDAREAAEVSCN